MIQSGRWPGRYVAFAYYERGGAYQGNGDFDRAISDYSEAIRLDPGYLFADYDRGSELRSAELRYSKRRLETGTATGDRRALLPTNAYEGS